MVENQKRINQMEPWMGEEEKKELMEVVDSGWFVEYKKTKEFEKIFANFVGSNHACAVTSGTSALYIALKALDVKAGDEVIVPDMTFVASANAVEACGATPILVDVDRKNLCLNLDETERAVTQKTKAIMPVHFNGRCPDMGRLVDFTKGRGIPIVEDACHTIGSREKGKHLGTFGTIGVFSFATPKIITTTQGGMLVTDDAELKNKFMMLKDFGRDMTKKHDMIHAFEHTTIGYNYKFTEFQAAVGLAQMKKLDWRIKRKKEMYKSITELLQNTNGIEFLELDLKEKVPWFNDCLFRDLSTRTGLVNHLETQNIGTRLIYPPIHKLLPFLHMNGNWPITDEVSQRGLWLPSSTFLTNDDIERVCREIKNFLTSR